jgi:HK97 family phage major capsid protein
MLTVTLPNTPGAFISRADRVKTFSRALSAIAKGAKENKSPFAMLEVDDPAAFILKAAQNPAMSTVPEYAGFLTREITAAFHDELAKESVMLRLGLDPRSRISLDGFKRLVFPVRNPGNKTLAGGFRAEGQAVRIGGLSLISKEMNAYSMGIIATATMELMDRSVEDLEAFLLKCMREDTAAALDPLAFSTEPGVPDISPRGLLFGAEEITSTDIRSDVNQALRAFVAKNGNRDTAVWLMHPTSAVAIQTAITESGVYNFPEFQTSRVIHGMPVVTGASFPRDKVVLLDLNELKFLWEFKGSKLTNDAMIVEEDTSPATVDGATAAGQSVRSLMQTNSIAIRTIHETDWLMTRDSIVYVSDIDSTWGQP